MGPCTLAPCTFLMETTVADSNKLPPQQQTPPGFTSEMKPVPDHGEASYVGSGKLDGKVALITGGDSGIGRAVAIAFAREGADVVLAYLSEDADAESTAELIRQAGRRVVAMPGDICDEAHCAELVDMAISEFGRLDILVNNAAFQRTHKSIEEIPLEEWETTLRTNVTAPFMLAKAAVKHLKRGAHNYQYDVDPVSRSLRWAAGLRHKQGRDLQFHRWPRPGARREGHPGERRRPRTDLDASHPFDHAA